MNRPVPEPRFLLGTRFLSAGKHPHVCVVTDILRTLNLSGELVGVQYVAEHDFCGQKIGGRHLDIEVAKGVCRLHGANNLSEITEKNTLTNAGH